MRILVLGDVHLPWTDYVCLRAAHKFAYVGSKGVPAYKPDLVIQVGDFTDQKAWSRWPKDPDDPSAEEEWSSIVESVRVVHKLFPRMTILEGNHGRRIMHKATEAHLPRQLVKTMAEAFPFADWTWHLRPQPLIIDGMCFIHGDEMPGNAAQKAQRLGMSVIQGHDHLGYLHYAVTFHKRIFGMSVGTFMDEGSIAARYAAKNPTRCFKGWGTITDGVPQLHPF